ncbi:MAG TPA: GNAT family N-acetyltransferase [Rhizomicrobium sp.]|jgi:GNAT superfamily N-acetyltransferase|nr:GNAT family N-acetyltransferase [Rhizomicrobium sp.]
MSETIIRPAQKGDEETILNLLGELAVYERLEHRFHLTPDFIADDFFCAPPAVGCDLAFLDQQPAGIVTWYPTYSSFAGTRGVYIEDFYVRTDLRRRGIGRALLAGVAKRATNTGATKIEWAVLKWNRPGIDFYESVHAERVDDWHIYRLVGKSLADLAAV